MKLYEQVYGEVNKPTGLPGWSWRALAVAALAGMCLWALGGYVVYRAVMLPTVYESYSTGYCVRVEDPRGVHSCEDLPPRFYHVWTE